MKKFGIFTIVGLVFCLMGCGIKTATPSTVDQQITTIMDKFDQISRLDADRKTQIEEINAIINKKQAPLVDDLKAKLRMLHVLNAERADQIVDENFPGLWGDGKTVGPIWVRKTKKTEPFIPTPPVIQTSKGSEPPTTPKTTSVPSGSPAASSGTTKK
jgi:hypothetical protein